MQKWAMPQPKTEVTKGNMKQTEAKRREHLIIML
jgi:hypothetical protein